MNAQTAPSWHAGLWARVGRAIADNRVAHGLLICGAPGVGKRAFAQRVVRALVCRDRRADGEACGVCPPCRQYAVGTHPDIARLVPDEPGRAIKVEQVRALSHALHLTSQYATGRIGWIDPAEALSTSAANSLLKTLEEPPAGCHIVLVSDRVSALAATLRSRCQLWRVSPAAADVGAAWMTDNGIDTTGLDADALRMPYAASARANAGYDALVQAWDADLVHLLAARADAVECAERAAASAAGLWIDWAYRRANGLLAASLGAPVPAHMSGELQAAARRLGPVALQHWAARVDYAARLRTTNADWRLVVESLLLDLAERTDAIS